MQQHLPERRETTFPRRSTAFLTYAVNAFLPATDVTGCSYSGSDLYLGHALAAMMVLCADIFSTFHLSQVAQRYPVNNRFMILVALAERLGC